MLNIDILQHLWEIHLFEWCQTLWRSGYNFTLETEMITAEFEVAPWHKYLRLWTPQHESFMKIWEENYQLHNFYSHIIFYRKCDYNWIQCGNTAWIFIPTYSATWFLAAHRDENAPWKNLDALFTWNMRLKMDAMWQHNKDIYTYRFHYVISWWTEK